MEQTIYRIVSKRGSSSFDVEIAGPNGKSRTVPGFGSEHEANAWIIQAKRLVHAASPWEPVPSRKSGTR
jgi:hypothetical protein